MKLVNKEQENHLLKITRLVSMYQSLEIAQLGGLFPELGEEKLKMLLGRLEKSGRLAVDTEKGLVLYTKEGTYNQAVIAAFWVLLDFYPEIIYHTASEYPVALTFYTDKDSFDVIYVPSEKEVVLNHALRAYGEGSPHRLVIVEHPEQISRIHFPGITAYCIVLPDGKIQYFRKQGEIDS